MSTPTPFVRHRSPPPVKPNLVEESRTTKSLDQYYSRNFISHYFKKLKITR